MISWAELRASLYGAYLLCRWDAQGFRWIDTSPAGALRSFWLAVYQLPVVAYLYSDLLGASIGLQQAGSSQGLVVLLGWLTTYGFDWAVDVWFVMLVMRVAVAPPLRRAALAAVLSVLNWLGALQILILLPLLLLSPVIGEDAGAFLSLLLFFYIIVVLANALYRIFNGHLKVAIIIVLGLVALDFYVVEQYQDLAIYLRQIG